MFDRGKLPATGRGAACLSRVAALRGRVEWCNKGNCPAADILCTAGIVCNKFLKIMTYDLLWLLHIVLTLQSIPHPLRNFSPLFF